MDSNLYSGPELWGVLLDYFYQFEAPISILFLFCRNTLLDNIIYIISITNPLCILVFLTIQSFSFLSIPYSFIYRNICMVIHTNGSENSIRLVLVFWARFKTGWLKQPILGEMAPSIFFHFILFLIHRKWDSIFWLQIKKNSNEIQAVLFHPSNYLI